jgi:hypothetical protein
MTHVHGLALKLRLELDALARKHAIRPPLPPYEPLLPECDDRAVLLSGLASTFDIDSERLKFLPGSLKWSQLPELRWRHQPGVIGTVETLKETIRGLTITVMTDHHLGKVGPAFSIAATIHSYELRNTDNPDGFHAAITKAHIDEISLTPMPANAHALVFERWPMTAAAENWRLLGRQCELMQTLLSVMRERVREA